MDNLNPAQRVSANLGCAVGRHAPGEFGTFGVADPDHVAPVELALTSNDARRQEAPALIVERRSCPVVDRSACRPGGGKRRSNAFAPAACLPPARTGFLPPRRQGSGPGRPACDPRRSPCGMPERMTIRAAASLEAMPPTDTALSVPPARLSSAASMRSTLGMTRGFGPPNPSMTPSTVVSTTRRSAGSRQVTSADNRSLSPNFNSVVETVSFSLIIGITPRARRVSRVLRALRCRPCCRRSSCVSSTWPTGRLNAPNNSL